MDTFDLDLEDLDLKTVDMNPTIRSSSNNDYKNINVSSSSSNQTPSFSSSRPNLTISSSNSDPMPSMGMSSDKEVDFGLNLLVNKKKQRSDIETINKIGSTSGHASTNPSPTPKNFFSDGGSTGGGYGYPQKMNLDDTELLQASLFDDNITNIDLDKELNSMDLGDIKPSSSGMSGPKLPDFGGSSMGGGMSASATSTFGMGGMSGSNNFGSINTGGIASNAGLSYEDVQKAKFDLLCKFERLRDKGVKIPKTFSMSSDYDEMKYEYDRLIHQRKMSNSVKMQRQMLVTFCSGMTFLNEKFDPIGLKLEGFDEHVNDNIGDYDDIFEELYEKYKESANMAPELKLMMTLGGSAFMYHLSNSVFKSAMPNPSDILKQNPDLMKQFQAAAMGAMGPQNSGFSNFMGNMMGGNNNNQPPKYNPMAGPPFANPRDAPPRGSTNVNDTDDIDNLLNSIS
jgi:hypothetical protein